MCVAKRPLALATTECSSAAFNGGGFDAQDQITQYQFNNRLTQQTWEVVNKNKHSLSRWKSANKVSGTPHYILTKALEKIFTSGDNGEMKEDDSSCLMVLIDVCKTVCYLK